MTNLYELGLYSFQFIFWTASQHVSMQALNRFAPQAWYVACICIQAYTLHTGRTAINVNA